jgi:hypothetical protein
MVKLRIGYASHDAVKWACVNYHYAKVVPAGAKVSYGVWEDGKFIGAIIFGPGANRNMGSPYGLKMNQVCELVRVALTNHKTPVSRILSICLKMLSKKEPNLKLIVSYADANAGHHGGIYQACGWTYVGESASTKKYMIKGVLRHPKGVDDLLLRKGYASTIENIRRYIDSSAQIIIHKPKHKYLYAVSEDMRRKVSMLAKPYPKRLSSTCVTSAESGTAAIHAAGGGANPTVMLNEEGGEG